MKPRTETTCVNIHKQDCNFSYEGCGKNCIGYINSNKPQPIIPKEPQLNESIGLGGLPKGKKK